jgi:Mrp family chromosome partitioning ATPase
LVLLIEASSAVAPASTPAFPPGDGSAGQHVVSDPAGFDRLCLVPPPQARSRFNDAEAIRAMMRDDLARYAAIVADLPTIVGASPAGLSPSVAAGAFDTVILVAMTGRTAPRVLTNAVKSLAEARSSLAGIVANDLMAPTLGREIAREARRFGCISPMWAARVARWSRRSSLLSGHA